MNISKLLSFLCLLILPGLWAQGQGKDYFISNGRKVRIADFNRQMERMLAETDVPGASVAVIENGKIVFYHVYGRKDNAGDKVDPNTVFEGCSLSKSYLVYVAFTLVDQGLLDLDKPVSQYLPNPRLSHDDRYLRITPRMILSHSSGIENWQYMHNPDTLDIVSNPGATYIYSGEAYNYLAQAIAAILGKPYEDYVRERLLQPLHLDHSYLRFIKVKDSLGHEHDVPGNYALGHDPFGFEYEKWKNEEPVPSSGNNITAADYARLMVATFDGRHLSRRSVRTILTPVVRTGAADFPSFYGTGYEIYYNGKDTIVGHGGDNQGFRAQALYSIPHRRGFVFLTNSDRGKLLTKRISALTAGLDVRKYYEEHFPFDYPSKAVTLFRTYRAQGRDAMFASLQTMESAGALDRNALTFLGGDLMFHDPEAAIRLLRDGIRRDSTDATAYGFLGEAYLRNENYEEAYNTYLRARALHFKWWDVEPKLRESRDKMEEAERRSRLLVTITDATTIEVENYNAMHGLTEFGPARDSDEDVFVVHLFPGNWMDYRVDVKEAGDYLLSARVATAEKQSALLLEEEGHPLASIGIPSTGTWFDWKTFTTRVHLTPGLHTLRLRATGTGQGFGINWIKLKK